MNPTDLVGQIEAALRLDHVGKDGQDGPVLLDQAELDLSLIALEVLLAHGGPYGFAVRSSLIFAAFP